MEKRARDETPLTPRSLSVIHAKPPGSERASHRNEGAGTDVARCTRGYCVCFRGVESARLAVLTPPPANGSFPRCDMYYAKASA